LVVRVFKQVSDEMIINHEDINCYTIRSSFALLHGQCAPTTAMMTVTTMMTTMAFPLLLGIGWGKRGLWLTMTTTLTAINVKTDCPVRVQG
jgi:hypothetical protein